MSRSWHHILVACLLLVTYGVIMLAEFTLVWPSFPYLGDQQYNLFTVHMVLINLAMFILMRAELRAWWASLTEEDVRSPHRFP